MVRKVARRFDIQEGIISILEDVMHNYPLLKLYLLHRPKAEMRCFGFLLHGSVIKSFFARID